MKASISVPDDLWDRARSQVPDDLPVSALVQEALRVFVAQKAPESPRLRVERPDGHDNTYNKVRDSMAEQARVEAQRGYVAGLTLAESMDWGDFQSLAERHLFDLKDWAGWWKSYAETLDMRDAGHQNLVPDHAVRPRPDFMKKLVMVLGNFASPHDTAEWIPAPTYLRGVRQALAELWQDSLSAAGTNDQL